MANVEEVLNKIEFLFKGYSTERRATTQPYLLDVAKEKIKGYEYDPSDSLIRETLMEHVGSTPVVATALFPYIQDPEVDLGQALVMLAIHDIGELVTHDKMVFTKKEEEKEGEREAAIKLLDPYYHSIYRDSETKTSKSAKFAKAIDKITPDILDYLTPVDITVPRYQYFVGIGEE